MKVLISACLLGVSCNYKQTSSSSWDEEFSSIIEKSIALGVEFIPVCPEQLGGLSTPRPPSELKASSEKVLAGNGVILNINGLDVTANFVRGAQEALYLSKLFDAKLAILKSKSPSCGIHYVYDGHFSGVLIKGSGVTAKLLIDNDLHVIDENEFVQKNRGTEDVLSVLEGL